MDQSKGLSALGYLSFYFAPFIVPIILFFVSKEDSVRYHAKRAFISHLIPIFLGIIFLIIFISSTFTLEIINESADIFIGSVFIAFIIFTVISFIIAIWNLVQAIKVLR